MGFDVACSSEKENPMSYVDAVLAATEAAAKHFPPIHASAQREFVARIAAEKATGGWIQHAEAGVISAKGETIDEVLARTLIEKSHYLIVGTELSRAEIAWIGRDGMPPTLADQGARVLEIGEVNAKAEALLFGTTLGSTKRGKLPSDSTPEVKKQNDAAASSNPWSPAWGGDLEQRRERQASIIRGMGTKAASDLAADGKTINRYALGGLARVMNSEEARERSRALDQRLREKLGLAALVPLKAVKPKTDAKHFGPRVGTTTWDARLTTKRKNKPGASHRGGKSQYE